MTCLRRHRDGVASCEPLISRTLRRHNRPYLGRLQSLFQVINPVIRHPDGSSFALSLQSLHRLPRFAQTHLLNKLDIPKTALQFPLMVGMWKTFLKTYCGIVNQVQIHVLQSKLAGLPDIIKASAMRRAKAWGCASSPT